MQAKDITLTLALALLLSGCTTEELIEAQKPPLTLTSSSLNESSSVFTSRDKFQPVISYSENHEKGTNKGLIFLSAGSSQSLHPIDVAKLQELTVGAKLITWFDFDSYHVKKEFKISEKDLSALKSSKQVMVIGHTDSIGSEKYNFELGRKRAEDIKNLLVSNGVPLDRITIVSMGETESSDTNATRDGRSKNRRVEVYGRS
jgi:outer membrane protein OmpA-like peptidoglycan-associated protein